MVTNLYSSSFWTIDATPELSVEGSVGESLGTDDGGGGQNVGVRVAGSRRLLVGAFYVLGHLQALVTQ